MSTTQLDDLVLSLHVGEGLVTRGPVVYMFSKTGTKRVTMKVEPAEKKKTKRGRRGRHVD